MMVSTKASSSRLRPGTGEEMPNTGSGRESRRDNQFYQTLVESEKKDRTKLMCMQRTHFYLEFT